MEKICRPDHVRNGEVLQKVEEEECPNHNGKKEVLTILATSSIRPAIENMLLKEIQRKGEK
jgi:hypothetical protein